MMNRYTKTDAYLSARIRKATHPKFKLYWMLCQRSLLRAQLQYLNNLPHEKRDRISQGKGATI